MSDGEKRLFAGRGIQLPRASVTLLTILICALLGIGVGWASTYVPQLLADDPSPSASPSPSADASASPVPTVSLDPLPPITRELTQADADAGLSTLDIPLEGMGTFTVASRDAEGTGDAAGVRAVRVEFEDGLAMGASQLSDYVMGVLNDYRGWGARGRFEFVPTQGAADMRVIVASPYTAALMCPEPHATPTLGGGVGASASASPNPSASPSPAEQTCADQGILMISAYDWAAGLEAFEDDYDGARAYLVEHAHGHLLGEEETTCSSGRAEVMDDQFDLDEDCTPNAWPFPDEPQPSPSPEASATPGPTE